MAGLILEGGTFRPIFSCGVMDAFLDEGIMFPYIIGVSAGITDAFSYVSRQKERNLIVLEKFRDDKRYMGMGNYLHEKSYIGLDFAYKEVPKYHVPFDWETFRKYDGKLLVGVTNANTGRIEYIDGMTADEDFTMLRATCALPVLFPPIEINGQEYYDGGIADSIPIKKAIMDGNEKNVIILTRTDAYRKTLNTQTKLTAKALEHKYPKISKLLMNRHERYNYTVEFIRRLEAEGKVLVLRPEYEVDSMEKDVAVLRTTNEMGYRVAMNRMDEIKRFLAE